MVRGLVARAASGEQIIRPAWILQGPSLTLPKLETALQGRRTGPKATNGFLFAGKGLLCTAGYVGVEGLGTRLVLVPQLDGGDVIRVGSDPCDTCPCRMGSELSKVYTMVMLYGEAVSGSKKAWVPRW